MDNRHLVPGLGNPFCSLRLHFSHLNHLGHISEDHREPSGPPSPRQWVSGFCPPQA